MFILLDQLVVQTKINLMNTVIYGYHCVCQAPGDLSAAADS